MKKKADVGEVFRAYVKSQKDLSVAQMRFVAADEKLTAVIAQPYSSKKSLLREKANKALEVARTSRKEAIIADDRAGQEWRMARDLAILEALGISLT